MVSEEIICFLRKKGTLEILVEIGHEPQRHTDLREKLLLSSSTVHDRLKAGIRHGLWEQRLQEQPDGLSKKVYELTALGQQIRDIAQDENLQRAHIAKRQVVQQVTAKEDAVLQYLETDQANRDKANLEPDPQAGIGD
jgi:DNA-binding HxlR family transcriptional regulator